MGTSAFSSGSVEFNTNSPSFSDSIQKVADWIEKANNCKFTKDSEDSGDYSISITSETKDFAVGFLYFEAESGRVQNLEWQLDRLNLFCQTLPDCIRFQADVQIQGDSVCWERE